MRINPDLTFAMFAAQARKHNTDASFLADCTGDWGEGSLGPAEGQAYRRAMCKRIFMREYAQVVIPYATLHRIYHAWTDPADQGSGPDRCDHCQTRMYKHGKKRFCSSNCAKSFLRQEKES